MVGPLQYVTISVTILIYVSLYMGKYLSTCSITIIKQLYSVINKNNCTPINYIDSIKVFYTIKDHSNDHYNT